MRFRIFPATDKSILHQQFERHSQRFQQRRVVETVGLRFKQSIIRFSLDLILRYGIIYRISFGPVQGNRLDAKIVAEILRALAHANRACQRLGEKIMKRPVLIEHLPGQMNIFEICGEPPSQGNVCAGKNPGSSINTATSAEPLSTKQSKRASRPRNRNNLPSDLLTARFDDAGLGQRPTCNDLTIIQRIISIDIPEDVPSPVIAIASIRRFSQNIVARLHLFDGGTGTLTVQSGKDEWTWDPHAPDKRPFHYINGAWKRFQTGEYTVEI